VGETYEAAGVNIAAGEAAVERIKPLVRSTYRPEVLGDIGGFGGLFDLSPLLSAAVGAAPRFTNPVLVSATDGVGTKAMVAHQSGRFDSIGIDLVAMCVDDLVCVGAEPLLFLDYISVGELDGDQIEPLVAGVANGCRQAGCALVGGEMAEHPGAMAPGEFDLVGFAVGMVDRDRAIDGQALAPGDVLIGLHSPGLRSNGYSLARRLYFDVAGKALTDPAWDGASQSVADELLVPSVIYAPTILKMREDAGLDVHGVVHITGGGIPGNVPRILNPDVNAQIDMTSWEIPRVFQELQRIGDVAPAEMARTFNLGIGMIVAVPAAQAATALAVAAEAGHPGSIVGEISIGLGRVNLQA